MVDRRTQGTDEAYLLRSWEIKEQTEACGLASAQSNVQSETLKCVLPLAGINLRLLNVSKVHNLKLSFK